MQYQCGLNSSPPTPCICHTSETLLGMLIALFQVEYIETTLDDVYFALKNNPKSYDEFNDFLIF